MSGRERVQVIRKETQGVCGLLGDKPASGVFFLITETCILFMLSLDLTASAFFMCFDKECQTGYKQTLYWALGDGCEWALGGRRGEETRWER